MRRLSRTILILLAILAAPAAADLRVELVTVGPGDAVWEKFGHNMIRFHSDDYGPDFCFNWGLFDFNQPNFIYNFVQGRMLYTMDALKTQPLLDEYRGQNRRVTFQELRLQPWEKRALLDRCEANRRPGHADYRYDYFQDNCSTRVRDMLDKTLRGRLAKTTQGVATSPVVTWRSESIRLTQGDFWISLGMDFAMGPRGDKPLDRWADGFLPESVAASIAPFAEAPTEMWQSTRPPEPTAPPRRWPWLMLTGIGGAGLVYLLRGWPRRLVLALWWVVSGLGGAFMTYMWVATDHVAAHTDQNLWQYSPLALAVLVMAMLRFPKTTAGLAMTVAGVSVLGAIAWGVGRAFGGPIAQANGGFIMLALPLNLASAWATRTALTKPTAALEVTE